MKNQARIIGINGTSNPAKVQLHLVGQVEKPTSSTNALALFNEGDDRFTQAKDQNAWLTVEKSAVQKYFGVDVSELTKGERMDIELPNSFKLPNGELGSFSIQVTETTTARKGSTQYDVMSIIDKDGTKKYFLDNGALIYRYVDVVIGAPAHTFIEKKDKVSASMIDNNNSVAQTAAQALFKAE
jgi:hypothetical protein